MYTYTHTYTYQHMYCNYAPGFEQYSHHVLGFEPAAGPGDHIRDAAPAERGVPGYAVEGVETENQLQPTYIHFFQPPDTVRR